MEVKHKPERRVHEDEFGSKFISWNQPTNSNEVLRIRAFFPEDSEQLQFSIATVTLDEVCYNTKGMVVHSDDKIAQV